MVFIIILLSNACENDHVIIWTLSLKKCLLWELSVSQWF